MTKIEYDQVFFKEYHDRIADFDKSPNQICHYTSIESFINILKSREIWMRNASLMNDYQEIQFGFQYIAKAIRYCEDLRHVLGRIEQVSRRCKDIIDAFKDNDSLITNLQRIMTDCYIFCCSEVSGGDSDGLLSMWRGYGSGNGVAILLKKESVISENKNLRAFISPVEYETKNSTESILKKYFFRIGDIVDEDISFYEFEMALEKSLIGSIVSMKHFGFSEEREWRVISSNFFGYDNNGEIPVSKTQVINGEAQTIRAIKLKKYSENFSLEPNDIFEKVIIGPCRYPLVAKEAIIREMELAGVTNANERVEVSSIPFRK